MTQDNTDSLTNDNSDQSQLLLEILEQLQNIHITLQRIEHHSNSSVSPTTAASRNSRPSSVTFPTQNSYSNFEIGDRAVINHRFRNQFGLEGIITKTTQHFVWIQVDSGRIYKKHKRNILLIE
jgi:hypothetical protein